MMENYYIKTFGCQQNVADSERIMRYYNARGYKRVTQECDADVLVINTCMIRNMAEERVYGYIRNRQKDNERSGHRQQIILTGCIVGAAAREPSGTLAKKLQKRIPNVILMPIEDVGFEIDPVRGDQKHAWVTISNGCNNHCAFCIVPFARGVEVSRSFGDIIAEVHDLANRGYESITLLGQNVNSYGADLVLAQKKEEQGVYLLPNGTRVAPVMVDHLGRTRIPTLFPYLLEHVATVSGINTVTFTSSNPWDFSDQLIDVLTRHHNIDRLIHLPVQSGSDHVLKKMNRWYTAADFLSLTRRITYAVPDVTFATDIIVGFPGETDDDFQRTVDLVSQVGFVKAFIGCYSERPGTVASQTMPDTVSWNEKKRRWHILNEMINKKNSGVTYDKDWVRTREQYGVSQ